MRGGVIVKKALVLLLLLSALLLSACGRERGSGLGKLPPDDKDTEPQSGLWIAKFYTSTGDGRELTWSVNFNVGEDKTVKTMLVAYYFGEITDNEKVKTFSTLTKPPSGDNSFDATFVEYETVAAKDYPVMVSFVSETEAQCSIVIAGVEYRWSAAPTEDAEPAG